MGCGTSFVKYVLFFFNLLVALLALLVIGIGVAFQINWAPVKDEIKSHVAVAPWLFIVIGSIMFVIAFFGCCGAIRESHCMVVTYAIFLLVIIIMQVVIAVLMFTYGQDIKDEIVKAVNTLYDRRSSATVDPSLETVINQMQQQFQCCGRSGRGSSLQLTYDASCCSDTSNLGRVFGDKCTIDNAFTDGCPDKIGAFYDKWNKPIAGVAIGVACVEVVGALFALCLANSIRNMDRRYA